MATTWESNYYPPILETYMPAFVIQKEGDGYSFVEDNTVVFGDTLRIYFALSPYTNLAHSKYMHVKIVDQ